MPSATGLIQLNEEDAPPAFDEPAFRQTWASASGFAQTQTKAGVKDAPDYFNEPTWRQTWPSATGLEQLGDAPAHFNEPAWEQTWPSAAGYAQQQNQDAPPYFNEPTWHQTWPSATGLAQQKFHGKPICNGKNDDNCSEPGSFIKRKVEKEEIEDTMTQICTHEGQKNCNEAGWM